MNTIREYELITKVITGEAGENDKLAFDELLKTDDAFRTRYHECKKLWDVTPVNLEEADVNEAWARFSEKIKQLGTSSGSSFSFKPLIRIAAAVLMFAGIGIVATRMYYNQTQAHVQTASNEIKSISLPDGSTITLNGGSSVKYSRRFKDNVREIALSGEAFFDVAKDPQRPFVILTQNSRTEVLGTSFNIKEDQKGNVELNVSTGKVKFTAIHSGSEETLVAGEAAVINLSNITVKEPDVNAMAWISKKLVFRDAPMKQVISTLQDYFKVEIKLNDTEIENCHLTAEFDTPKLSDVLDILSRTLQLTYTIKGKQVTLSGKGCN